MTNQETRDKRLDEILHRQLGTNILAMIEDPSITDILVNDNGQVWYEGRGGLHDGQFSLTSSQVESIIGTAAASLGAVANAEHPIVEGELPIGRIRFEGLLPPIARKPCFALRLPALRRVVEQRDAAVSSGYSAAIVSGVGGKFFADAAGAEGVCAVAGWEECVAVQLLDCTGVEAWLA